MEKINMDETGKDNVGFSLLTTENPLTVNNDDQEDHEAEEEQRRRQQELQSMMAYAFDDIGDEENSTINSSFENSVSGQAFISGHTRNDESSIQHSEILEDQYRQTELNSEQQMKVIYQVQEREIKRLTAELNSLKETKEKELTQLKRKILLMENDHNGTAISLKQCQDLLVEKKRDIEEKLQEINNLKDQIDNVTISKRNADEESQMWKTKYSELEQKMNLIDQGLYIPISERQIRNKYEQEISELQQALEQSQKNLEKATKAKSIAENETKEIKQTHEIYAMEKDEEVHHLYSQLENSKFQCHNLTDRIDSLEKEYQNLTTILNNTTKETEALHVGSTMKTIQAELKRSLDDQKLKRDEIIKLENQLILSKNNEAQLQQSLLEVKAEASKITSEKEKVSLELATLKKELETVANQLELSLKKVANLNEELQCVQVEKGQLEVELKKVQTSTQKEERSYDIVKINSDLELLRMQNEQLYKQLEDANKVKKEIELQSLKKVQELQSEMKSVPDKKVQILEEQKKYLQSQFENLQKDFNAMKLDEELYKNQFEKYETLCLELEKTCAEQKSQLLECHTKITEMEGKLVLKEKRDDLLDDLQQKALMFEQYIKTKSDSVQNKSVNTSTDSQASFLKLHELSSENAKLKEKIMFDRAALNELTSIWNGEITRLNSLVTELKAEITNKDVHLNKEMTQMSLLIQKLTGAIQSKDLAMKEIEEQARQERQVVKDLKRNYQQREAQLLLQFEQNMSDMKNKFLEEEKSARSMVEGFQGKCVRALEELNDRIGKQIKYNNEKHDVESKIIEAYYDLIIQQTRSKKK